MGGKISPVGALVGFSVNVPLSWIGILSADW